MFVPITGPFSIRSTPKWKMVWGPDPGSQSVRRLGTRMAIPMATAICIASGSPIKGEFSRGPQTDRLRPQPEKNLDDATVGPALASSP